MPQMRKTGKPGRKAPSPARNHEPKRSTRNFRRRVTLTDYLAEPDAPAMFSSSQRHSEAAPVEVRALRRVWEWGQGVRRDDEPTETGASLLLADTSRSVQPGPDCEFIKPFIYRGPLINGAWSKGLPGLA